MNHITKIADHVAEEMIKRIETEKVEVTMTELERTVRQVMQEAGRLALGKLLAAQESKYVEREVSCECGEQATYRRRRKGRFRTILVPDLYKFEGLS